MARGKRRKGGGVDLRRLCLRLDALREQRERFVPAWREISRYITPGRGKFDEAEPNRGDRRDEALLDPTPYYALNTLAAGMQGGLTSRSRPWFRLGVSDPDLADDARVRRWLDEVERRMTQVMGQSNLYNSLHTLYAEVGAFGTGAMLIEEDPVTVIRCTTMTAGAYSLGFGPDDRPDAFGRTFWMSAGQMADEFGYDVLSEGARNALDGNRPGTWFEVNQLIWRARGDADPAPFGEEMPVASAYWESAGADGTPLRVAGYREFPVVAPRWDVLGGDTYGRGPGWYALGESKTLQELRHDYLVAQKLAIRPPMQAPTAAKAARADLRPGAVTYATGDVGYRPLFQVRPDIPGQMQAIADSRGIVRQMFYVDLFLMLASNDTRGMTAREVAERHEEKLQMLGPVLERMDTELLDPLIGRVFVVMDRFGLVPPPPEELEGRRLEVEYISMLAQAQLAAGIGGVDQLTAFVANVAGADPSVLDKIDLDEAVDQYGRMLGTPASIVRSGDEVAEMRQRRAEEQAMMQQMAAMQQAAQTAESGARAAKDLSGVPLEGGGNVLEALAGAAGGDAM